MHSKKITVRFASAVSAAVIGFTSTAISFFDCPVYAAYGGAAWGEFFGFYSLLEGFGFGQDNTDFINSVDNWIDSLQPEEKPREDYDGEWMTDAQYWQQCQYDKFTGWLDNLVDSWSESYDAVGDVGSGGASGGSWSCEGWQTADGMASFSQNVNYPTIDGYGYFCIQPKSGFTYPYIVARVLNRYNSTDEGLELFTYSSSTSSYTHSHWYSYSDTNRVAWGTLNGYQLNGTDSYYKSSLPYSFAFSDCTITVADYDKLCADWGIDTVYDSDAAVLVAISKAVWQPGKTGSDGFIGPVYTYPAAQELARQNKTSTGIRLDVKTADGVPDVKAALDGAGVSTVDELAASVAAGDVAMQDVFADAKVTPYVVADTASGVVVTDLGVAADAAGVKPVALTKELTVPADLTTAATYAIQGKTWDPDMAKYRLPLFQYFPFCLPWDIYQVLTSFAADPVAPQIEIPIGKFFANKKSFDGSAVANYTATLDLGDEKFSKWFSALRLLESAGIIIGLVLISVHLIHGGR